MNIECPMLNVEVIEEFHLHFSIGYLIGDIGI